MGHDWPRPNREITLFGLSWWLWLIGVIVVVGVTFWVLRWLSVPGQVVSPENVRAQWAFAYQYEESLRASALQVCQTEKALNSATSDSEKSQRRSQLLAFEQNYTRIQATYDGRLRDAFQAKLVKPVDVPDRAPTLEQNKARVCTG